MPDQTDRLASLLDRAQRNLALDASPETARRLADSLQSVAAELALEWIAGERRFENQSQQTGSCSPTNSRRRPVSTRVLACRCPGPNTSRACFSRAAPRNGGSRPETN